MAIGKRYEIYLPLEYNPDEQGNRRSIEAGKFAQTQRELWDEFGGATIMPESADDALKGFWIDESGEPSKDKVFTTIVYATDINKADHFFGQAIATYKKRFQQKEILILSWIVERIEQKAG